MRRPALAAALALALSSMAVRAAGAAPPKEAARAEQLFEEGTHLLDEKKYADALPKLLESQRLGPGIGVTMYLGDCYDGLGRTATAIATFREAEQLAHARHDSREAIAETRIAELATRVPSVVVRVGPPIERGIEITLDDAPLAPARWQRSIDLDPGSHVVRAALGTRRWETTFELPPRAATTLVQVPALGAAGASVSPAPAAEAPPRHDVRMLRVLGISQLTGGVILAGVGLLFGLAAIEKQAASNDAGHCDPAARCDAMGLALRHDGLADARVATALVSVGAVVAVAGAALYLFDGRR